MTLANKITLARLLGIPVFAGLEIQRASLAARGEPSVYLQTTVLVVFMAVALTDALDGYIARSRRQITELGRLLDPLADKALTLTALVLLTHPFQSPSSGGVPIWFTTLVIGRDILLAMGAAIIRHFHGKVQVQPHFTGKIATFLIFSLIVWVLADAPAQGIPLLLWSAGAFTAISGMLYLRDGIKQLEPPHHG